MSSKKTSVNDPSSRTYLNNIKNKAHDDCAECEKEPSVKTHYK
ncbi:hypothetical protein [Clostridium sp. BJN0001]|nr:hypothetical protein [Clostridium sp. BJN0001]